MREQEDEGDKIGPVLVIGISVLLLTAALTTTAGTASATATANRTLPAEPVPAGGVFTVVIEVSDYGIRGGFVNETLPEGFLYLKSTIDSDLVHFYGKTNTVKFILFDETSFDYTVTAPDTEGSYSFSGLLVDEDKNEYEVGGDTEVVVEGEKKEENPMATRTLPEEPVPAGESFTVEIEATDYGIFGKVVETLPEGFVYEASSLNSESVEVEDNTVEFELWGEPSFTYTVTAPDTEGTYTFSGTLEDEDKNEYEIEGDTEIEVGEGSGEVTLGAPNITAWNPVEAVVNNTEGEQRTFNLTVNQTVNISWLLNGTEVQTNESVTEVAYTNASAVLGTWNISAVARNTTTGLSARHTWIWSVTPAANTTATPTPTSTAAPTPSLSVTPTPTFKPSPTPPTTSSPSSAPTPKPTPTPKSALPGFEAGFAFAGIFAVAYLLLLFRKKRG